MPTVVVIGAAGMLGREVALAAEMAGSDVVRVGRAPRAGWLTFDAMRDDPTELFACEPDLVVNCAAVLASDIADDDPATASAARQVNGEFPHALAEAASIAGSHLVHISTDAVFADDAGVCFEHDTADASDIYGRTKLLGEPRTVNAISIRCSFVGRDPERRRGLLEWLLGQPDGTTVTGFSNQWWNGLVTSQVAHVCVALTDPRLFHEAQAEGPVHHLFENPPLTKADLLATCGAAFGKNVRVDPTASARPINRILATTHGVLQQCLQFQPSRAMSLAQLAERTPRSDD